MNKQLTRKLAGYSVLAAAIAIPHRKADAQIIYSNPPDILLAGVGAHSYLDLDNNGIADVNVRISPAGSGSPVLKVEIKDLGYNDKVEAIMTPDCEYSAYTYSIFPHKAGKLISDDLPGIFLNWNPLYYGELLNWGEFGGICHRWSGAVKHFVGFRRKTENWGDYNYGWIRLSINITGSHVIIHDWAYNGTLNEPVFTGQTMREGESELTASPEIEIYSYGNKIIVNQEYANPMHVHVFNSLGQVVLQRSVADTQNTIELPSVSSGIYFVKAITPESELSKTIMAE